MSTVVVIAATAPEISSLREALAGRVTERTGPFEIDAGMVGRKRVIAAASGMGKVNTAMCLAILLREITPELVISTGCAGAFIDTGLDIGSLAVSSGTVYGDEGVLTPAGWDSLRLIGIPLVQEGCNTYFNEFPVCPQAAARAMTAAEKLGIHARLGKSVTVSTCSGTTARGMELRDRFGAICENMEGAAAAQVALRYGARFMELRGISNMVEDRNLSRWNIPLAVETAQRFLTAFIETM